MQIDGYQVIAPALLGEPCNQSEALGAATWLWMQSPLHRDAPLHALSQLLLPAIVKGQFVLLSEQGKPVCFLSWARFSRVAEYRYLHNPPIAMALADWDSGSREWILDLIAPFGHGARVVQLLRKRLLAGHIMRSLYHRGSERGIRIKHFVGGALLPEEARTWLALNPPAWELKDE
ncbi:MAG: toxin-activating lysine-acyltransferase [Paludibacterium sp.]|uniref:toxin-activating lysine-acyltransferase n=1 Tax=Paludibacterium sp. TaxID=1917523 RepID=UPI0025D9B19A|nr:toxin-activating lysine-acyltransferase [Paludibacterium sp.]MBV8046220.1 toxin-activating lysine-acyltransferase [Paludibacterium sp.]MBV8649482.1 toxin-activating lysine-acyltransferase [Paludibacterium sp.]